MFWCYCESLSPKIITLKKPGEFEDAPLVKSLGGDRKIVVLVLLVKVLIWHVEVSS